MPLKRNTPGCPCCSPTGCDVTFVITACCGPAVGASVTVKDGSGTTKGTGTTNSSGSVTISLAGTSGTTLYVTVAYDATHYNQYTGVILGDHCGRTYDYSLVPITETYGTACGTLTIKTTRCDGTTLLGSKAWTLEKSSAGGWTTYTTGTTNATTAISTVTGLTYGGAYDYYRFNVTDATGGVTGTSINLTNTNCVATCLMRMATSALLPCTTPQDAITYSGGSGITTRRGCCNNCGANTIPGVLYITDPCALNIGSGCAVGCTSYTRPLINGVGTSGCNSKYNDTIEVIRTCPFPLLGVQRNVFSLWCDGSTAILTIDGHYNCYDAATGCAWYYPYPLFSVPTYTASTLTCSPFAATFSIPSLTLYPYGFTSGCGTKTVAARTITITE